MSVITMAHVPHPTPLACTQIVFLVDCSTTMLGAPLDRARTVLRMCLDRLA
jgi:hypothetical protein